MSKTKNYKVKASIFITCLVDQLFPAVGTGLVSVLKKAGVEVTFPKNQTCCGQPLFNSGFRKDAKELAKQNIEELANSEYIVVPSGSCAAMMKFVYKDLFGENDKMRSMASSLSPKVYEFSEFIVKILGVTNVGATYREHVTYHPSCHLLREQQVDMEPKALLDEVCGLVLEKLEDETVCCGFGGTFSVKYPGISEAMLMDKIQRIEETSASTVVACDLSCLMHIDGALRRKKSPIKAKHLIEILDNTESLPDR
jgi:L-lactate dehydrogenase complex protein LldE